MIDLRTAGLKIIVLTFSMVSIIACKKIFLKPQPVVQKDVVVFNRFNYQRRDHASANIFKSKEGLFVDNVFPYNLSFRISKTK